VIRRARTLLGATAVAVDAPTTSLVPAFGGRLDVAGRSRRRRWPWLVVALLVASVGAAFAFSVFAWPQGQVLLDPVAFARVEQPTFGGHLLMVEAVRAGGGKVPLTVRKDGRLLPRMRLQPGEVVSVEAVFRRPGWIGWVAGDTQRVRLTVIAPGAHPLRHWLRVATGAPLRVGFTQPVKVVTVRQAGQVSTLTLAHPQSIVGLGDLGQAGTIFVAGAPRSWERPPAPTVVSWFPTGRSPKLLASPLPNTVVAPDAPIRLRFSEPLTRLLHGQQPVLTPRVPGRWTKPDDHTLLFTPSGYGFGFHRHIRLTLPLAAELVAFRRGPTTKTLFWTTPTGSLLRLQQLLAQLDYLPLRWTPTRKAPDTLQAQLAAATTAPAGSFSWRYTTTPRSLIALWQPGRDNLITRGALMAFEATHKLPTNGLPSAPVWRALIIDTLTGKRTARAYNYVIIHGSLPQRLLLWHNGHVIFSTPANTGIAVAPTQPGTFPVYVRYASNTMSGTNPDGTHYSDPGVPWISYFNGGDAIHGFNRASYGSPQSLGCVELPITQAARVWPDTPIGTLVTITS
jgi:lipoprotein-anchoring transpeptidase ErfK/SrfK